VCSQWPETGGDITRTLIESRKKQSDKEENTGQLGRDWLELERLPRGSLSASVQDPEVAGYVVGCSAPWTWAEHGSRNVSGERKTGRGHG
jgi:hypothetical protein